LAECLCGRMEMASRAGLNSFAALFGPQAPVCRPLLYSISDHTEIAILQHLTLLCWCW